MDVMAEFFVLKYFNIKNGVLLFLFEIYINYHALRDLVNQPR